MQSDKRIDGRTLANQIKEKLKHQISDDKEKYGIEPGLAVVLVGARADSSTYVRMKRQAASEVGINFILRELPADISETDLVMEVKILNNNPAIHGLIVQLPLPDHIDEELVLNEVSLEKDIDGFHPLNMGYLCMRDRDPMYVPCTPKGCMTILKSIGVDLTGKHIVVIGKSNIVGIPVSMLCLHQGATVTICHSHTQDIETITKQADVLIVAVGRAQMVKKEWLKDSVIVIDVGINSIEDSSRKSGYRLVGDVDYEDCLDTVSQITPVPGGVGPMTVVSLLENTYESFSKKMMAND